MNWRKIKIFIKFYWIRISVFLLLAVLGVSLVILMINGIRAWRESESFIKQSQLAQIPLQLYLQIIMAVIFGAVYTFMWYWLFMKKGAQSMTQRKKKAIAGEEVGIKWSDVIGMEEAKQEASEVVRLITDRAQLQRIGGKILRGLLMVGPPGCGKTYLAKAIATESKLPFISMSGSEFVEMFVGVGASRIRQLFKQAREFAYIEGGCIIFIDEIDAVGAQRAMDRGFGGTTEHNTTLNQLLVEMDGLKDKDYNVVLIGATNIAEGYLDQALLRPGRFDRKIYVGLPDLEDRVKLFEYYLKEIKYSNDINLGYLAKMTVGNTPADIANIVRESALIAVRNTKDVVSMKEINDARERIALGIKRKIKLTDKEKKLAAYHESGHAIITYLLVPTKDVFKATIVPRGSAGGVTWTPEKEETLIRNQNDLLGEIKICLGGYVAEKIKFGFTSAGVDSDFKQAMAVAHHMSWSWGMGKSGYLGNFHALESQSSMGRAYIADETKSILDKDAQGILQNCLKEVEDILKKEINLLDKFAQKLIEKEELEYDEIEAIFKEADKARPI